MISVQSAQQMMQKAIQPFPSVEQPLLKSYGCVLRADIVADRPVPAGAMSVMDGIAVRYASVKKGVRKFLIEGLQAAGHPALDLKFADSCVQISTGALISGGCDTVIPIEKVKITEGKAMIAADLEVQKGQFIRKAGSLYKAGAKLVKAGAVLGPVEIAVAGAVGAAQVTVSVPPQIAVVSTGDELVDIDQPAEDYQIRKSNSLFIQAALQRTQLFKADLYHFRDNLKVLKRQVGALLERYDALVTTGGVSMGELDLIPQTMADLNVECLFHKVKQRPGMPFWFGTTKSGKPVFALPGNPLAAQIGTYRHVIPQLKKALGSPVSKEYVVLTEPLEPPTRYAYYCPVTVDSHDNGNLSATPQPYRNSGDFAAMVGTAGFVEIPPQSEKIKKGQPVSFYRW
ncbi:MAG: molybdopterin molybdotransferase MoeA [Candidatus Omnitrophica bacterium]|nr:molybdopterin molybdotransferase MoeA [Candidatus Omnitrophota bacterium]